MPPKTMTPREAYEYAQALQRDFQQNELMKERMKTIARDHDMDSALAAFGVPSQLRDVLPYQLEAPNQEGHEYANALSIADLIVEVYGEKEGPEAQKQRDRLEQINQGITQSLLEDDYAVCRHMATVGLGIRRLDVVDEFFKGQPDRDNDEQAEAFVKRVNDHRRRIGLPFEVSEVDPDTFYFEEDRRRREVIFAAEFTQARESDIHAGGRFDYTGNLLIVRTHDRIYHWWQGEKGDEELVYDKPNPFDHTGYFLYRGRYTGLKEMYRRYEPFNEVTLNQAQVRGILTTLVLNLLVLANLHWTESEIEEVVDSQTRQVSAEQKLHGQGTAHVTEAGAPAAEFEPGVRVRFREMASLAGLFETVAQRLDSEEERYRFRDVLMGEAAAEASGRAIIRLQEAAGRQLTIGFRARRHATEQILRVVRHTIFTRPEYLKTGNELYVPYMVEGLGGEDAGHQEVLTISEKDNVPHFVRVKVEVSSQAAQAAMREEGMAMEGKLPRSIIDQEFYGVRNLTKLNQERVKDLVRAGVYPTAVEQGVSEALEKLQQYNPQPEGVMVPNEGAQAQNGARPPGATPGTSARPDAVQREDIGLQQAAAGQGVQPLPEGG